ncbi:MAG: hypothetical protein XD72_2025, partial [Methanothrix harundinacea]
QEIEFSSKTRGVPPLARLIWQMRQRQPSGGGTFCTSPESFRNSRVMGSSAPGKYFCHNAVNRSRSTISIVAQISFRYKQVIIGLSWRIGEDERESGWVHQGRSPWRGSLPTRSSGGGRRPRFPATAGHGLRRPRADGRGMPLGSSGKRGVAGTLFCDSSMPPLFVNF